MQIVPFLVMHFCNNHIGIYSNNYFYDHPASIEQTVFVVLIS